MAQGIVQGLKSYIGLIKVFSNLLSSDYLQLNAGKISCYARLNFKFKRVSQFVAIRANRAVKSFINDSSTPLM